MVKCADCGLLSIWTGGLDFPAVPSPIRKGRPSESELVCAVDEFDLTLDVGLSTEPTNNWGLVPIRARIPAQLAVLGEERNCESFIQYRQMHGPKEHVAMQDRRDLLDREDTRDREMRKREDRRDAETRAREDQRDIDAKGRHRMELVVFGVAIGLATLFGSTIEASWIPKPW